MAGHNYWGLHPAGVVCWHGGCMVPNLVSLVGVPFRDASAYSSPLRFYNFRIRRDQRRRRTRLVRERLQGVPPRGLFHLASKEGGQPIL